MFFGIVIFMIILGKRHQEIEILYLILSLILGILLSYLLNKFENYEKEDESLLEQASMSIKDGLSNLDR